jgi:hypothetical protein
MTGPRFTTKLNTNSVGHQREIHFTEEKKMTLQVAKRTAIDERSILLAFAWIGTLMASLLPAIIWQEFFAGSLPQALWVRIGSILLLLGLSQAWKIIRPLRDYYVLLLVIFAADEVLRPLAANSELWQGWFGAGNPSLFWSGLGDQLLRLLMTFAAWAALLLMGLKRDQYFLVKGRLDAPTEPVCWLGIKENQPWRITGRQFAATFSLVFLIISVFIYRPSLGELRVLLPYLPAILLFASLNAFNENFVARAALLSQLEPSVGKQQALLLAAALFGIWHFYGTPPGLAGVMLTGFLGWVLGKSILETRGFLMAWSIQLPLDFLVFAFWLLGTIAK